MNPSIIRSLTLRKGAVALVLALCSAVLWSAWQRSKIEQKTAPISPSIVTLSISPQTRQTVKGWDIYPSTFQSDRPQPEFYTLWNRPNAQRLIYALRPTLIRTNILPNSYDSKRDDGSLDTQYLDASLVRHLEMARRFGVEKYTLTVWSPPALFKNPPTTRGQLKGVPSKLRVEREANYCRFVVKTLDYLTKKRGFQAPIAYSIQNEPGYDPDLWDGTAYGTAQWQRVFVLMRRALDVGGYRRVQLIEPEGGSYAKSVAFSGGAKAPALEDAAFSRAMAGFAFHGYTYESRRPPYLQELRDVALKAQKQGKDVWMTEFSIIAQSRTPLEHALETSQRLAREMTWVPCNYWLWWQGWYFRHPKGEVLLTGADDKRLHVSKTYYVLERLWASVPPGSKVHFVTTSDPELSGFAPREVQTVAFATPRGQTLLVVNPTSQAKRVAIAGMKKAWMTDAARDMAPQNAPSQGMPWMISPRSIWILTTR